MRRVTCHVIWNVSVTYKNGTNLKASYHQDRLKWTKGEQRKKWKRWGKSDKFQLIVWMCQRTQLMYQGRKDRKMKWKIKIRKTYVKRNCFKHWSLKQLKRMKEQEERENARLQDEKWLAVNEEKGSNGYWHYIPDCDDYISLWYHWSLISFENDFEI